MRMKLLKIVVVLLVAGSGETRPQKSGGDSATQLEVAETSNAGWRAVRSSNKSHDIVRDDSRYRGTSGSSRKSYITHFRDNIDLSRMFNAVGSRMADLAPIEMTRSLSTRHSKIDDTWTLPEFKAPHGSSDSPITGVSGGISEIDVLRNSNKTSRLSFNDFSSNDRKIYGEEMNRFTSILSSNESSKSNVISSKDLKSVLAQTRSSSARHNSQASHASAFERADVSAVASLDKISAAEEQRKSSSVRSNSFSNKGNMVSDASRWESKQNANTYSLQSAKRMNITGNLQADVINRSFYKITDGTNSYLTSYENLKKTGIAAHSFRQAGSIQRDSSNNSGKLASEIQLRPNVKLNVAGQSMTSRIAMTSNRNFVRLHRPASSLSNQIVKYVANLPLYLEVANSTRGHFAQTIVERPNLDERVESMSDRNSSHVQESNPNERDGSVLVRNAYLKNWPSEALQDMEDLYNYEKYTASLIEPNEDSGLQDTDTVPILPSEGYIHHPDPVLESSVKKIIHWLQIPPIVPNSTYLADDAGNVHKPVSSVLQSIYGNLNADRPPSVDHQNASQYQDLDRIDYHEIYPSSIVPSQYVADSLNPSSILTSSPWPAKNNTVPTTHVSQHTVVHILSNGSKRPNMTVLQSKVPQSIDAAAASSDRVNSSGSSVESFSGLQRPNVHITSSSQKGETPAKQETSTISPSSGSSDCPTILINSYTRVNNTLQSKEGCTDLNIIINSHILNTNHVKPSDEPTESQHSTLATQNYSDADESNKYADEIDDDLSHQDSSNTYVTASSETYSSSPLEYPPYTGDQDYYDSQKNPGAGNVQTLSEGSVSPELYLAGGSTVEVFQGTQISVSDSYVPLADAGATVGPILEGADGAAGASVDGPGLGEDALSPAVVPVAVGSNDAAVMGQANNALVPGSLQLPALNLPSRPSLPVGSGLSGVQSALTSSSGAAGASSTQVDDDDDDDYDMSPSGVLSSIASVFTYFSFLNPLGYSFFSLAAAPFAAMAAGVLGVAAFIFPWALPDAFDLGRAADGMTIPFRPNVEEFVRQAVRKYDCLNEWKSRRRKRRK